MAHSTAHTAAYISDQQFSKKMQALVEHSLKLMNPKISRVNFFPGRGDLPVDETRYIDKYMGCDGTIVINIKEGRDVVNTFQSKIRRAKYSRYGELTLETDSNKFGAQGEMFHLGSQFYIYGYANKLETGIDKLWVLDVNVLTRYMIDNIDRLERNEKQNFSRSTARFITIPFNDLEQVPGMVVLKGGSVLEMTDKTQEVPFTPRKTILGHDRSAR